MLATHPEATYAATVSHLCRAIRKLSAITLPAEAELPLYRGVRGELPDSFWVRGELGLICATDTAFMSTFAQPRRVAAERRLVTPLAREQVNLAQPQHAGAIHE